MCPTENTASPVFTKDRPAVYTILIPGTRPQDSAGIPQYIIPIGPPAVSRFKGVRYRPCLIVGAFGGHYQKDIACSWFIGRQPAGIETMTTLARNAWMDRHSWVVDREPDLPPRGLLDPLLSGDEGPRRPRNLRATPIAPDPADDSDLRP